MNKKTGPELIYIEWEDSQSYNTGWDSIENVISQYESAELTCQSIGWIIHEDEKTISIASNYDMENNNIEHVMRIPISAIRKRKKVILK